MPNTLLTPQEITRESLRVLHQKLKFIGNINREYDDSFAKSGAKIGDTLKIRKPNKYTVRTGRTASPQSTNEQSETLTVATQKGVDMTFFSNELTTTMDNFSKRVIEPAMAVLASEMEKDALSMVKDVPNCVGTPGSVPNELTDYLNVGRKLDEYLAPEGEGRTMLINPAANVASIEAFKTLFHDGSQIKKQYLDGYITRAAGFNFFQTSQIPVLTCGSRTNSTPVTSGAGQEGSSLVCSGFGATVTIKKGDSFTLTGIYAVHPETKVSYDFEQQFTATADATCSGGNVTLSISPAIVSSGAYQNVSAAPGNGVALVFAGTASTNYPMNIGFHRDAFTFVSADLELYEGQHKCVREVYDGISMRYWQAPDIRTDELITRLDVLYGYKAIRPLELACRLWG